MKQTTTLGTLRRFAEIATDHRPCDLCRCELANPHRHVMDVTTRSILCACNLCAWTFSNDANGRFRPIPQFVTRVDSGILDDLWNRLDIPIGMAFFTVEHLPQQESMILRAVYPSPGGPIVSSVDPLVWQSLFESHHRPLKMQPDVESLLVRQTEKNDDCFIAPIDRCYELVGIVRRHWDGWSGGTAVHEAIDRFFLDIDASACEGVA